MGLMSNRLRREKTRASGKQPSITFNAPGTYYPKYGKYNLTVGGRGASGTSPSGGNVAYYNPGSGGNYAYTNPDLMYGSSYTEYYDNVFGYFDSSYGDSPWGPSSRAPKPFTYTANPGAPGYSVVTFNVEGYNPGNDVYNPYTPGNAVYNPYTAGAPGTPVSILGVTFPGGATGATAPTVPDTITKSPYQGVGSGVTITVPPGGFVTIKES